MKNLEASFRATRALYTAAELFKQHGFNKVGVDRIVSEAKMTKATFYNYFHSKERLIEMCLLVQKEQLKRKSEGDKRSSSISRFGSSTQANLPFTCRLKRCVLPFV